MNVKDCMNSEICYVKPETTILDVAKLMNKEHIGSIVVCDDEKTLCGIVTDRDIVLRGIACDKDINTTPISEIMTNEVYTCMEEDDIYDAEDIMSENQIRRLPVCDGNNKVVGILTLGDLIQNDEIENEEITETLEEICECKEDEKNNS